MVRLIVRRLLGGLLSVWIVVTLVFIAVHFLPGDPAEAALSQSTASADVLEQRREILGLDRPLAVQYVDYIARLLRADLGISWSTGQSVSQMLGQQFPATLSLAISAELIAIGLGVLWGYGATVPRAKLFRRISRGLIAVALGTPIMFSGTLLIWVFAIWLGWFPATGQGGYISLVLPAIAVGASAAGGISRAVEAGLGSVLDEPFLLVARAKGRSFNQAVQRHALLPALLPVLSIVAVQFGYLIGGAVVAEAVFARQGIGRILIAAVLNQDLPVVQAVVVVSAACYILLNLLADIVHASLDPRVKSI